MITFLVLLFLSAWAAAQDVGSLRHFDVSIRLHAGDATEVVVRTSIEGLGAGRLARFTLLQYAGRPITRVTATDGANRPLAIAASPSGSLLLVDIAAPADLPVIVLHYTIAAGGRVPLPVPAAPPRSGEKPVELAVRIPAGHEVVGIDSFTSYYDSAAKRANVAVAVGHPCTGHADEVQQHRQDQPQPIDPLNAADTLHEPYVHQRGERQEQEAEAGQDKGVKGEVHLHRAGDPVHQQHDARECGQ